MVEKREYVITQLSAMECDISLLLEGACTEELLRRARTVIDTEGPITRDLLEKRIINSLGFQKIGSRIRAYLDDVMPALDDQAEDFHGERIYHNGRDENFYRPQQDGDERNRYSYQIPLTEAMNVVRAIYQDDVPEGRGLLKRELSDMFVKKLGYTKHGTQLDQLFETIFHIFRKTEELRKNTSGKFVLH